MFINRTTDSVLNQINNNSFLAGYHCCSSLRGKVEDVTVADHAAFFGEYNLISSAPVLYRNKISKLYITKDPRGNWVVRFKIIYKAYKDFLYYINYD